MEKDEITLATFSECWWTAISPVCPMMFDGSDPQLPGVSAWKLSFKQTLNLL